MIRMKEAGEEEKRRETRPDLLKEEKKREKRTLTKERTQCTLCECSTFGHSG